MLSVLTHVIITRFSYRGARVLSHIGGESFHRDIDPLDPGRLELRFRLFEITCLPSLFGQTDQDFTWVILIDGQLSSDHRRRLSNLVRSRRKTFIHVFDPAWDLSRLEWLGACLPPSGHVITTNIDDDDCIPRLFVASLRRYFCGLQQRDALPPVAIVGAKSGMEWDLLPSAEAPLGWLAQWHRKSRVLSVGFSLCSRLPPFDLCVLGLRHIAAENYLDFSSMPANDNVHWFREAISAAASSSDLALLDSNSEHRFYDISRELGPVLLCNHAANDQSTRLHEPKAPRVAVTGAEDLPGFCIRWDKARELAQSIMTRSAQGQ
jgi:Putative rhamnosyl transferase